LAALDAIEKAKVPLLDYKDGPAVKVIAARLNADRIEAGKAKPTKAAAHSILRRLLDLRNRLR
jgi:hypothetical protein